MSDILADEQSAPASPSAGQGVWWPDNAVSRPAYKDDAGRGIAAVTAYSVADQAGFAADTYVTGSRLVLPSFGFQAGTRIRWRFSLSKTGAGVATPIYNVRIGTAGAIGDTARWTHTGVAQTAITETGWFELNLILRNVGAAGVLQGSLVVARTGGVAATGLAAVPVAQVTSAGFDTSWASGLGIGISINAGASAAWTITQVQADIDY